MVTTETTQPTYRTLEEICQRKEELSEQLQKDGKQIATVWNSIFAKQENSSKGDYIASLVTNSVTIIDLFLLYRKIRKSYGGVFNLFSKNSKKKR